MTANLNQWAPTAGGAIPATVPPVKVLIIGKLDVVNALQQRIVAQQHRDRFQILATATTQDDAMTKIRLQPEAIIIDATLYTNPMEVQQALGAYTGNTFVLLLGLEPGKGFTPDAHTMLRSIPSVRDILWGNVSVDNVLDSVYTKTVAQRRVQHVEQNVLGVQQTASAGGPTTVATGFKAIAFWSPQGGVGKTTISIALAMEAARRGVPVLLVEAASDNSVPVTMNLERTPNITTWYRNPTLDNLRLSVQRPDKDGPDILVGFPDVIALDQYQLQLNATPQVPARMNDLVTLAARGEYALLIFDASAPELAPDVVAAANYLVLVAPPTLTGIHNVVSATRLLNQGLTMDSHISPDHLHVLLNRVVDSQMSTRQFMEAGTALSERFPSLIAAIDHDPAIVEAMNHRKSPDSESNTLRSAARVVADILLGTGSKSLWGGGSKRRTRGSGKRTISIGSLFGGGKK